VTNSEDPRTEKPNGAPATAEPDYVRTSDLPLGKTKEPPVPLPIVIIGLLLLVVVASIGYWQSQVRHDPTLLEDPVEPIQTEQRYPAPDIQFSTRDGKLARLSDYRGKVVLLSFWAHWCAPCLVELPSFKALAQRFADKGLVILPVNLDDKGQADEDIDKLWAAEKFPFTTYYDYPKAAIKAFNVEDLPANFVIDRQGKLVFSSIGSNDWNSPTTIELLDSLIAEN
jgi:peroxiredoxin